MERKKSENQQHPVQKDSQHSKSSEKDIKLSDVETESEVISEAIEVLKELPEEQKEKLTSGMIVAMKQSFRGPIPPAKELQGYKDVLLEAPDRIIRMAEYEQSSRIHQKKLETIFYFIFRIIGQMCGLAVSGYFAYGAIKLGMNGHDSLAGKIVGFTLVSLVSVFVISKIPYFNPPKNED